MLLEMLRGNLLNSRFRKKEFIDLRDTVKSFLAEREAEKKKLEGGSDEAAGTVDARSKASAAPTPTSEGEVAALLSAEGARAPTRSERALPPVPAENLVALRVIGSIGDYRSGDIVWLRRVEQADLASALNRDVLVPRPAGRFVFGRLIAREGGRMQILPPGPGSRQQVVNDPPWLAVAETLIRAL